MAPTETQDLMRDGRITSRCEAGIDNDAGCWRPTFYHGARLRDHRAIFPSLSRGALD